MALAAFVTVWGGGIPVAGARSSWDQFVSADTAFLAVLLPWVAARCGSFTRRDLVVTGFITSRTPQQSMLAKSIALIAALIGFELSGLPVTMLMRQIAAVDAPVVLSTATSHALLAMYVAVVTLAIAFMLVHPIRVWLASTALTLAVTAVRLPAAAGLFVFAGTGIAAAVYLSSMRARLIYLPENEA
jgi:hypothetical protein